MAEPGAGRDPGREDAAQLARAFARCFAGADGARVLDHLRRLTTGRVLGPEATCAALRHLEGQRALVAHIAGLVARGRRPDPLAPDHPVEKRTDP